MKIALVHDYLSEYGGAERVLETLHEIWPEAPVYTAFVDWRKLGTQAKRFEHWDIRTSWVQHFGIIKMFISPLRFLAPWIWKSFDLSEFDVVVTSSGWFMCRGVNAGRRNLEKPSRGIPLQICYIHHPPKNLYGYATGSNLQKYWPVRLYAIFVNFFLRNYDFKTAQQVDYFIANSKETAARVKKFYRRESTVIYPPIKLAVSSQLSARPLASIWRSGSARQAISQKKNYYLSVSRLWWAKRVDLAIGACNTLHLPLKIVGVGHEIEALKKIAGPTIEFLGSVSDTELAQLYNDAKALLFCALDEDFGMVPVEAMAHGTPVVALAQGGVKETVLDGKTGILFSQASEAALIDALKKFELRSKKTDWSRACLAHAQRFSKEKFQEELKQFVKKKVVLVS